MTVVTIVADRSHDVIPHEDLLIRRNSPETRERMTNSSPNLPRKDQSVGHPDATTVGLLRVLGWRMLVTCRCGPQDIHVLRPIHC